MANTVYVTVRINIPDQYNVDDVLEDMDYSFTYDNKELDTEIEEYDND